MTLSYASLQDRVEQFLQNTGADIYTTTISGMWIEEAIKEFSRYDPHIVPVIFKIESRYGTDVTGTASTLTDTVKDQFLTADATDEKVVHNTTDDTWAVVLARTSAEIMTLSADIMDANENYRIYNKRCWNEKQIYIGDVTDYIGIDSVEYPIGTKRNWKVYGEVLEIGVDSVDDSDSTLTNLGQVDVLVRFEKPQRLCQLADVDGYVHTAGTAAGKTQQVKTFTDDEVVEAGDEFTIANHRSIYTITTGVTFDNQASTGSTLTFFPGLEAATVADDAVAFTLSTLTPEHEEILIWLIAARSLESQAEAQHLLGVGYLATGAALINIVNKGGAGTAVPAMYAQYASAQETIATQMRNRANEIRAWAMAKMRAYPSKSKHSYPRD